MIPIYIFILFPIIAASGTYLVRTKFNKSILLILQFILFVGSIFFQFIYVKYNGTITTTLGHYPRGIGITLSVDLMASVFVMLTVFLFTCMFVYNFQKKLYESFILVSISHIARLD